MPPTVGRAKYEQELQLDTLFEELRDGFAKLGSLPDAKAQSLLKDLTTKMQEAKTCACCSAVLRLPPVLLASKPPAPSIQESGLHCPVRRLIKDFEREARVDNLPPLDLATRKKTLVQELNGFITAKKEFTQDQAAKSELIGASLGGTPRSGAAGLTPRTKDGEKCSLPVHAASAAHGAF